MRGRKPESLTIPSSDVLELERIAHLDTSPWYQVRRARIILGIASGQTAPLDRRLADGVSKAEGFAPRGKLIAVLPVDRRHARHLLVGLSCR